MISLTHETRGREVRLEVFYLDFQTCGWNTGNRSFHGWSWVLYERKTPCNFLSRRSRREKLRFKELGIACLAGIRSKMRCRCRRGLTRSMGTVLDGSTTGYCSSFRFPQPLFSYFLTKICFFPPLSDSSNSWSFKWGSLEDWEHLFIPQRWSHIPWLHQTSPLFLQNKVLLLRK